MRHVILTCKHHTNLRWQCKEIAFGGNGQGYNGLRSIFFLGQQTGVDSHPYTLFATNGQITDECKCSGRDLILAPEDKGESE